MIGVPRTRPAMVGLCLAVALGVLVVVELVVPPEAFDRGVLHWFVARRTPALTTVATAITNSGASWALFPSVAVAGLLVLWRTRRWVPGLLALVLGGIGVASRLGLSRVVGDERPPATDWLLTVHGFSFPSGHTTTSALVAGSIVWLLRLAVPRSRTAAAVGALAVCWAVLVGVSRLYLGVHWLTDVVGGWLLAGLWLLGIVALTRRLQPAVGAEEAPADVKGERWRRPARSRAANGTTPQVNRRQAANSWRYQLG